MTKTRLLIGFLCAFSGYAMAAPAPAEKQVAQAVDHLTQAMLHKDITELNALTAENLTYGHSSGKIQDKQAFIADIETGKSAFKTLEMQKQTITLSGDTALVRHHFSAQALKWCRPRSRTSRSGRSRMASGCWWGGRRSNSD